jgi:hypothetical protein
VHAAVTLRRVGHGANRRRVVGVDAHEELVVGIADAGQVVCQHLADDAMLAPQRHKDSDGAFGDAVQLRIRWPPQPHAPGEGQHQRDPQIVQSAQQDPDRERNQTHRHTVVEPHE